ncbi:uncharacterized protein SCHCODRAFT_02620804 [Schizophyllum commune H4-8]|uniref:uncharacterized protein n=1 Tax=Schizophyllum commune (strain H4-8 / FGSC 9210) TaxID=578458 RepID=UPI00215F3E08|nr:uncharacterized protein SCHCODRAFT_02620804 [Schizophyllum commune H4-8]KAI5893083.1 hypothetical protein SCHCODRAFT_02620804 [Schizophyllum commune H4-8]
MVSSQKVPRSVQTCAHCQHKVAYTLHVPPKPHEDHQLRAGQVPSRRHTRSAMKQAEAQLQTVKEEIQKMSNALATLKSMKGELREVIARQRTYLAPIRRLPIELLVEIFRWSCMPTIEYIHPRDPFQFAGLEIAAVCKLWRDIMYNNPRLWTEVPLPTQARARGFSYAQRNYLRRFDHCLEATQGLPLLRIVEARMHSLPHIIKYTAQWQDLRLTGVSHSYLESLSHCSFAVLHTLELDLNVFMQDDETWNDTDVFLDAPALRTVHIKSHWDSAIIPRLPWANIASLDTQCTHMYALRILARCDSLRHWSHSEMPEDEVDPLDPPTPVVLPHLQTMWLSYLDMIMDDIPDDRRADASRTLDHVTTPALSKLSLGWDDEYGTPVIYTRSYLSSFFERSKCPLRELDLRYPPLSERTYMPSQCDLRRLSWFSPGAMPLLDEDIARLAALSSCGKPLLWPNLAEVWLSNCQCSGEALVEMVEARRSAGCPLQCLDIDNFVPTNPNEDAMRKLRSLVPKFDCY